jgi:hypothetical protein
MFNILERMQPKPVDTTPLAVSSSVTGLFSPPSEAAGQLSQLSAVSR